jgi:hypothetical protein
MTDDIVSMLRRQEVGNYNALLWDEAADEIERLRAERDEARRAIIILLAGTDIAAMHRLADERGWDCFKEANK